MFARENWGALVIWIYLSQKWVVIWARISIFSIPNINGLTTGKLITFFCFFSLHFKYSRLLWSWYMASRFKSEPVCRGINWRKWTFSCQSQLTECILRGFFDKELDEIKLRFENNSSKNYGNSVHEWALCFLLFGSDTGRDIFSWHSLWWKALWTNPPKADEGVFFFLSWKRFLYFWIFRWRNVKEEWRFF